MAGAIVAARENRPVPLRLPETTTGTMQRVAIADLQPLGSPGEAYERGAFANLGEVATLNYIVDSLGNNHSLYRVGRFASDPSVALYNHKLPAPNDYGPDLGDDPDLVQSVFSP